jgi:hypothetical protein
VLKAKSAQALLESALRRELHLSSEVLDLVASDMLGNSGNDVLVETRRGRKRNLKVAESLLRELEEVADGYGTTVTELMRRFMSLGLYVARAQRSTGAVLIVREGDSERELVWL